MIKCENCKLNNATMFMNVDHDSDFAIQVCQECFDKLSENNEEFSNEDN